MKRLQDAAEHRVGTSQRKLAQKFGVVQSTINYNFKKIDLKYYKRQRTPKYTEKQIDQIPKKCRKIRRQITTKDTFVVIGDEKFFTFSNDDTSQNVGFYSFNKKYAPDNVKYRSKEKYPKKVLVWLALSAKGISTPFIVTTKGSAINAGIYINKCLTKLLPFIKANHAHDDYVFLPDLATSHYAIQTTAWLRQHNINFVPRQANPPNVPKARPIEAFWKLLSDKVYEGGWEAKTELQLKRRIRTKLKQIDMKIVQKMMTTIRTKLRKIEDKGPYSVL